MKLKKGTKGLFLKISDYKNYNYAKEHFECYEKNKFVWMLKMGRIINKDTINELIKNDGVLIIKSTVKNGNQFYLCKIEKYDLDENFIYPQYYNELFKNEYYDLEDLKRNNTWIKINYMKPIDMTIVDKFITSSSKRPLREGCMYRVSHIYIESIDDINI
mgnify:CR=1 FL=1